MKEPVVPVRDIARELSRRFSTMTHEEIDILENLLIPMKFKKGVEILSQGQVAEYIYYLHTGLIRQYYFKNGKEMTSNLAVDGSIFMSIESLFRETPSSEVIEALETCYIYAIPKRRLENVALHNQNIQILYRKILEEALIECQIHEDLVRFETAQDRYRRICKQMPKVVLRAPLVFIASFLEMTPETLSRVRSSTLVD
ncbi:MAG: Crp/Fnr family transcriptional regulator [Prevotella sp.]|nr:Crp/Fnr family transcriptional regulator [Prevotella sp.]MBO6099296.1 Crp/Fnr family transcriptional regulator [Prevotella sp.]MBO6233904.1 Crp/Fnr family transcriptional regulator [Prevotella sp.]MBP3750412.1 Crp/Fnr family transcriptional regulator [Prevotella sp.]MBQ1650761.1 Crp/Fnr family transcriptional regulator [Prevotella sp.]